jgi:large subunit ribosomal protein L6
MSRIARIPVAVTKGVEVQVASHEITVKGPLGTLKQPLTANVKVKVEDGQVSFVAGDASREAKAMSGTLRALVAGMVQGVSKGFQKKLSLVGVGYRAQAQGDKLNLSLGYSHPIVHQMPVGVKCETPTQTEILTGPDKQRSDRSVAEVRCQRRRSPIRARACGTSTRPWLSKTKKK